MKENATELVFILDKSGSMAGMEADTVGGFNAMLEKQKKGEGEVFVTTVLFSGGCETLHDRESLVSVKPLTEEDYQVGGCTALLDAVGSTIQHIASIHRYARPEDVPAHTLFFITTDGMENASREYSGEKVRRMIREREGKDGWEFVFLAANIDAAQTAEQMGIRKERAANYRQSAKGTGKLFECMGNFADAIRCSQPVAADWTKNLDTPD